jgi:hypothetical protein
MQTVYRLYHHLEVYGAAWTVVLVFFLLVAFRRSAVCRAIAKSEQLFYVAITISLVLTITYIIVVILYLFYPNYLDHYEATVSIISWRAAHGSPIYPDFMDPDLGADDIYGVLYGPLLFLTNGAVLSAFPTILGSKLAGCTIFLLSLLVTYTVFVARTPDNRRAAFISFMIVIVIFSGFPGQPFPFEPFWNRPEPFLILIGILSIAAASKLPPRSGAAAVGILVGLAVSFKPHGALYAMPALFAVLGVATNWKQRILLGALACFAAICAAALPFLLEITVAGSTARGIMSLAFLTAKHGLSSAVFIPNLLFVLFLFAPIMLAWYFRPPIVSRFDLWLIIGLATSLAMISVIGSKPGAGLHHLLPLVPISVYCLLLIVTSPTLDTRYTPNPSELATMILVSILVLFTPSYRLLWMKDFAIRFAAQQTEQGKIRELQTLYRKYPRAEVGQSDGSHYADTFYRVLLIFQGAPMHVDLTNWMDFGFAGVSESKVIELVQECKVPEWILPEGPPFTMPNYYTKRLLLSDEFRYAFFANYRVIEKGEYYQVWKCL